jgi:hypothetical protein
MRLAVRRQSASGLLGRCQGGKVTNGHDGPETTQSSLSRAAKGSVMLLPQANFVCRLSLKFVLLFTILKLRNYRCLSANWTISKAKSPCAADGRALNRNKP